MKPSDRLFIRLREMGVNVPEGARVKRTHAGWHQRQAGAWSWYVVDADGFELNPPLGSADTVAQCVVAERLAVWGAGWGYREIGADDA